MVNVFPVSTVPQAASVRNAFAAEVLLSATLAAAATGDALPYWSWAFTSTKAEQVPAVRVCGEVLKAMAVGAPGVTVTGRLAGVSGAADAVKVVEPATVVFQKKVTEGDPARMVTLVTEAPPQPAPA